MKIAIIGANGQSGKLILAEALKRGHEVTAIVRRADSTSHTPVLVKDVFELTAEDLSAFDVVVSAIGFWTEETFPLFDKVFRHVSQLLAGTETRFIVVGGAGSLFVDPAHTTQLLETPDFPAAFYPLAKAMTDALVTLRTFSATAWTFFSPAADFDAEGKASGNYQLGGEELILNAAGESYISYADYALALVDEIENGNFIRQRFTAVAEK
ncbi:NAD(P)-dependent oxidoreductase [Streptococcus moroccensis]|uniref:NADH-flavin reductase n=1 Tax=Streptococcus moroccensis TaxID=1451356 RepID=A0ABT9YRM7_9STRE|nr:NAD(P)-dependent oxidoreductase [Streptococcus moroccensis]MDQ0222262.1 putative NADH-flavin reductase [Streptococcus moroccensis]